MVRLNPAAMREIRESKAISKRELGRRIGASSGYVTRVERGDFLPREKRVPKIAEALGTSVDAITRDVP